MQYRVEISTQEWAGIKANYRWIPAIAGTYNQTGKSDINASTFDSCDAATIELERLRRYIESEQKEMAMFDEDTYEYTLRVRQLDPL